ncbi:uncharacterized protein LOC113776537 [Coffea eugenioides]|uniref:uncharacterized protein LOC113776537 n=1 Tax=Coffea eugenioides TaxID=49369 RepID=UPI000F614D4E|nr:uncharacterized protein LOC113776537 [Coffea eugenioides]XP_027177527.1 uncharacterized protein LOC113776537 [Coffea eugenioides]
MDICCPHDMSVSEDVSSFCALSLGPPDNPNDHNKNLYDDLGNRLTEFLHVQNKQKSSSVAVPSPNDGQIGTSAKEVGYKESHANELDKLTNEKCLAKCATFPCSAESKSSADVLDMEERHKEDLTPGDSVENGHDQSANCPYPRSISLPTPLKLVSAMKGSREKQGAPPQKLTVTWAADVYDPVPTSVSHVPSSKPQRYRNDNRRNGKNKLKASGKTSRGNRGKDKKQSRKGGGRSNRSFKPVDDEGNGACFSGPHRNAIDFDVGSPDPFCGQSFLKKSVTSIHFSVTEAT